MRLSALVKVVSAAKAKPLPKTQTKFLTLIHQAPGSTLPYGDYKYEAYRAQQALEKKGLIGYKLKGKPGPVTTWETMEKALPDFPGRATRRR